MVAAFIAGCIVGAVIGVILTIAGIVYFSGEEDLSKPHDEHD